MSTRRARFIPDEPAGYPHSLEAEYGDIVVTRPGEAWLHPMMFLRLETQWGHLPDPRENKQESILTRPPLSIENPHEFFEPVHAMKLPLRLSVLCSCRHRAPLFAALFDEQPDPTLLDTIEFTYVAGTLTHITAWPVCGTSADDHYTIPMRRDAVGIFHGWAFDRTDTRILVRIELSKRPNDDEIGIVDVTAQKDAAAALLCDVLPRQMHAERDVPIGYSRVKITWEFTGSKTGTVYLWSLKNRIPLLTPLLCERVAAAFDASFTEMSTDDPSIMPHLTPLSEISWHTSHAKILAIAMALAPLQLPVYPLLWILQQIDVFRIQREFRVVRLIEGVARSAAKVRAARLRASRYSLRPRVKKTCI